jgi:hypothetical protein
MHHNLSLIAKSADASVSVSNCAVEIIKINPNDANEWYEYF